jgi:serine/threonine protein kinase
MSKSPTIPVRVPLGVAPEAPTNPQGMAVQPPALHRSLSSAFVSRGHAYTFVVDANGDPIELGSGRFAKAYLGEERWLESKTNFRRRVAIKILQKGVSDEDALRFQMEKELLERAQGHPNIITLYASGESENPDFIPVSIRDKVENDYMVIELCELSLEERLKGARNRGMRDDLLAYPMVDRLFRVLEYMLPVSAAVEYAHLVRNICHRDVKPANVLLRLPDGNLQGSTLDVRLADFNVGKVREEAMDISLTRMQGVPGTLFFQSPEQETNVFELLVNVERGSFEVNYFEDFFMYISQNDTFQIFNRPERYQVVGADRARKKLLLETPFREPTETNVRAKIIKSVDRPADIYSLGAMFYYLVSGAYANPKSLYDAFHKFIEYERQDEKNTVHAYIDHEYQVINNLRAPKLEQDKPAVAPADRFFSYKHYLDGNGELLDQQVMSIVARAMIRNKPDSYCQAWDIDTRGISDFVADLVALYQGLDTSSARPVYLGRYHPRVAGSMSHSWGRLWNRLAKLKAPPSAPRRPGKPTPPA